jgi:hypothetical protein
VNWRRPSVRPPNNNFLPALLRKLIPARFRPIGYLTRMVQQRTACRVQHGPFAGMCYPDQAVHSAYLPKLMGIYERELNDIIEEICAWQPQVIIDLGAAEGYYAAGLARRNPRARVVAFEQDEFGRATLQRTLSMNGVQKRVRIERRCGPADLESVLRACSDQARGRSNIRKLVLCDVEGDERSLLNPAAVPSLTQAHVLVEIHEFVHPGITELLRERFGCTHRVRQIWQQPRSFREFPYRTFWTTLLPRSYLDWAVSEWRPCRMSWLWMKPRTSSDHDGYPAAQVVRQMSRTSASNL